MVAAPMLRERSLSPEAGRNRCPGPDRGHGPQLGDTARPEDASARGSRSQRQPRFPLRLEPRKLLQPKHTQRAQPVAAGVDHARNVRPMGARSRRSHDLAPLVPPTSVLDTIRCIHAGSIFGIAGPLTFMSKVGPACQVLPCGRNRRHRSLRGHRSHCGPPLPGAIALSLARPGPARYCCAHDSQVRRH